MNKYLMAATVLLSTATLVPVLAEPVGNVDDGRKYFLAARDLTGWSTGLYFQSGKRHANVDEFDQNYEFLRYAGFIGYDLFSWITPYVLVGGNRTSLDGTGEDQFKPELGFGMRFNLLHHDILDPTLFEDVIMVNASWQYSMTEAVRKDDGQGYQEFYATATISLLNEIQGSKLYLPEGIALYVGPMVSLVNTAGTTTKDSYGLVAGLEVFYTKRITLYLSGQILGKDSVSVMGGLNLCL